ncbi:C-C motif chemokine 20 [Aulostomus maculatus]
MWVNTFFSLLVLSCLCFVFSQVSYEDCCLKYVKKLHKSTQRNAVEYRHQLADGGCNIPAVIFTMRKGRVFCTDPRELWVKELMEFVDKKPKTKTKPRKHLKQRRNRESRPGNKNSPE